MRFAKLATVATLALSFSVFAAGPAVADLSEAARASAVLNEEGKPIGLDGYEDASAAVRAGDMAAYLEALGADDDNEIAPSSLRALILSVDAIADEDFDAARNVLVDIREEDDESQLTAYVEAWVSAFQGDESRAISEHRAAASGLPGYTADLSLAAMLEGLGRNDEALAVYASLTPGDIEAPEHQFDIQGLYFSHIRTVVARRALLLRRLGRIEEAKEVYRKLAAAEPERAVGYAAAIQSLESGEGLDDDPLTPRTALARTLTDISGALGQQRLIQRIRAGLPINDFDETKASLDQAALLLAPEDEDLRSLVINTLHRQAYYDGAAHVALTAPQQTPHLGMSAALALLLQQERDEARVALDEAIALDMDEDDRIGITLRAARLYSFLNDEETALKLAYDAIDMSNNDAERASTRAATADILKHFALYDDALPLAREALAIDNTHDRRTYLTSVLGELGMNDEALRILRREHLERPNDPYTLNTLGYYLISHTDKYEEGYKLLARAETLASNDPYIRDSYGWALYRMGYLNRARANIEASRERLAPERHWEIEDHLGDIYWHQGEEDNARAAWQAALEVYPPKRVREIIETKLKDGITEARPERRALPSTSLGDDGRINERDI